MKLSLSLSGLNQTLKNLEQAGIVIEKDFKGELINQGKELRDKAKEILERESQRRTGGRYWTGTLQESIKLAPVHERGTMVGVSVGPDMRIAPYAEWVEIGHFLVSGSFGQERGEWWEGYHYMEGAYIELAPEIPSKIAETLRVSLNRFGRTAGRVRHLKTGRFVPGFGGVS